MTHAITNIGLIVIFGIVMIPVYLMVAGWLFGGPRDFRTVGISIGYMLGFTVVILIGLAITGAAITIIVNL
ncbi:hypothetical protein [Halovivax gelatinilyticus]|uniref:hypothetical protein n=1 Tax=Halovivax gelatinilyticus TaxID=2961597 RepID=UPI0020CA7C02|nr:hypothetical protein [Halovivax gelatinilyticus]